MAALRVMVPEEIEESSWTESNAGLGPSNGCLL
jgi:hypothetical protein